LLADACTQTEDVGEDHVGGKPSFVGGSKEVDVKGKGKLGRFDEEAGGGESRIGRLVKSGTSVATSLLSSTSTLLLGMLSSVIHLLRSFRPLVSVFRLVTHSSSPFTLFPPLLFCVYFTLHFFVFVFSWTAGLLILFGWVCI
jgi:hypothetical protein